MINVGSGGYILQCDKYNRFADINWTKYRVSQRNFLFSDIDYTVSQKKRHKWFMSNISIKSSPNSKVRSVLKSAGSEIFKTVLDFEFLPSRSGDIGARTTPGVIFNFHMKKECLTDVTTLLDLQNLKLTSSITISDIFYTNDPGLKHKLLKILIFINSLSVVFEFWRIMFDLNLNCSVHQQNLVWNCFCYSRWIRT